MFPHLIYERREGSFYGNQEYRPSKIEKRFPLYMYIKIIDNLAGLIGVLKIKFLSTSSVGTFKWHR